MSQPFDLAIDGGVVFVPSGRLRASVYVTGGKIALVTPEDHPAVRRVEAGGLIVMPGMVDVHVHLREPSAADREDYPSGTAAAAVAGVTTVIEHTHSGPVRHAADLAAKVAALSGRALVDFALAAHAWPGESASILPLWQAGAAFFKAFTCTTHGVPGHSPAQLHELFTEVAAVDAICLVHCEDESITGAAYQRLHAEGRSDNGVIPLWRHRDAELVAVAVTSTLARATAANIVIAHASHAAVVDMVNRQQGPSKRVAIETCPQYLTLFEREVLTEGALRKFTPPARALDDRDLAAMWTLLAQGGIDYISSDHAPSTQAQKRDGSIWDVHFGLPGLDTTMPLLLTGAAAGKLTYERLVDVYATIPARLYGLAAKGRLERGCDADMIVVDPNHRWELAPEHLFSKAGWSPYLGRELIGRTVATYVRGQLVAAGGAITSEIRVGQFVPGAGAGAAQTTSEQVSLDGF